MKRRVSLIALGMLLAPAAFAQGDGSSLGVGSPAAAPESAISTPPSQHPDLSPQDNAGFNRGINPQATLPAAPAGRDLAAGDQHMGDMPGHAAAATDAMPREAMPQSGSTGPATSGVLAHVDASTIAKESKQTKREMTATALLNRFSQLGFAGVREFRRDGDHYVAEAQTMDGKWVNVTIDPTNGDVRANGPVG